MSFKSYLVVTVAVALLGLSLRFQTAMGQTRNPSTWPVNCARQPNGQYSRGAILLVGGLRYACANVRNPEWQSAGVTWVRVDPTPNVTDFVLLNPPNSGRCEIRNLVNVPNSNGEYSRGAALNLLGEVARCATVFDDNLNPAGVAWIDVRLLQGDDFLIRIH
jgi:hypothetical protein